MIRLTLILMAFIVASNTLGDEPCGPQRLVAPPGVEANGFGESTATNGRFWFVGDTQARVGCCTTGTVHVYEDVGGELVYTQTLVPHDAAGLDMFGTWISADGNRVLIGSYRFRWTMTPGRGGGFVYEFDGESWVESGRLAPPSDFEGDGGGAFVSLSEDTAALSVSDYFPRQVWIYGPTPEGWTLEQKVESPDPMTPDEGFGYTSVLHDEWLFAPAYRDATHVRDGGSVYVFRRDSEGAFGFSQKIMPPEPYEDNREFGFWLALNGHTLAIAARRVNRDVEFQGAIFIYELEGNQWELRQELTQSEPQQGDELGHRMALTGDLLLARTNRNGSDPGHDGTVLRFERDAAGEWHEVGELVPNPPSYAGFYGISIATDGRHAIVGAPEDHAGGSSWPGAGYFFDLACNACPADLDSDGTLTIFDFLAFANRFQDGDAQADFDGDGELTIFDFLAFQTAFDAGC
ncbi:MAG: GC-type dockerin domain-anchored protein [Phycisphaerales bacterium]